MANMKYSLEKREQVAQYVLKSGKPASIVAKELGIGINTVCRWVNKLREKRGLPSYEAERRVQKQVSDRLLAKTKELERRNRQLEKELAEAKEAKEKLISFLNYLRCNFL